jgi:hypothetical protein
VPVILLSLHSAGNVLQHAYATRGTRAASDYLLAHAPPGEAVWRDECMRLLIETNLRPGSRVPMSFLFANHDDAPTEYAAIMLEDFERTKPGYILLRTDFARWVRHQADGITELERDSARRENYFRAWARIRAYVESHYVAETRIERETVWRRRGS